MKCNQGLTVLKDTNIAQGAEQVKEQKKEDSVTNQIEALLLEKRRIFLCAQITDESVSEVIRKLWYLESKDANKPILLIINSPGGSTSAGFSLWDQVKMLTAPVTTLVTGLAASMGSLLSLVAKPGRRFATPFAKIMIHQPLISGVIQGQATDLEIRAKEILKMRDQIIDIYAEATGKSKEEIAKVIDRDTWFDAEEAKKFGLIDEIVSDYKSLGF
ncbi:ATP-dependent Clp protease proteolytic subunit [Candidatus Aerophobetes bacterium]|uniref:ATP-dependent Clp protease proteolytic subunit n=1 Tax=Aerophobetes bacterium TaxID=2030807 RepID=A0A2A4X8I8_UNCAE|nr:MAG: ATP-dependent Clp protease proteolytic subunit [Candidatus Aerophobetes bacterium]